MPDIKKPLKILTQEHLRKQIVALEQAIAQGREQINQLTEQVIKNLGMLEYVRHELNTFDLPDNVPAEEQVPEAK